MKKIKQLTYAIFTGIMWIDLAIIWALNGFLHGVTLWIMIICPIIWYIQQAHYSDVWVGLLDRTINILKKSNKLMDTLIKNDKK